MMPVANISSVMPVKPETKQPQRRIYAVFTHGNARDGLVPVN